MKQELPDGNMNRPNTLADVATRSKTDPGTWDIAIAGFLDNFYSNSERRQAMLDPEPDLTGDMIVDATIGAIGEHLARRWHLGICHGRNIQRAFLSVLISQLRSNI